MKSLFAFATILFSQWLAAAPLTIVENLKTTCEVSYQLLENGNYFSSHPVIAQNATHTAYSNYTLTPDSNYFILSNNKLNEAIGMLFLSDYKISDIEFDGNLVWLVANSKTHKSRLYRIEFNEKEVVDAKDFPTHNLQVEQGQYDQAYGISIDEKNVYIAHGGFGVVVFSKEYEKPISAHMPNVNPDSKHRSYATDTLVIGDQLILGLDNITYSFNTKTRAFEGYAFLNKENLKLLKTVTVNQKREAIFEPKLFYDQGNVIMSSLSLFFVNSLENLQKSNTFSPQRRVYSYEKGKPFGQAFIKDGQVIGCFKDDRVLPVTSFAHTQKL